jgi:cytochrome c biogenesis protein CcmG/thiol:disulfide interchange protein DsbE
MTAAGRDEAVNGAATPARQTAAPRWRRLGASVSRRRALTAAAGAGVLVAALLAVLATRSVPPGSAAASSLGGKPAPAIAGAALVGGRPVSLSGLRGRYVVVTFFASWCAPCRAEVPALASFVWSQRHGGRVAVLGVADQDTAGNARAFLEQYGATWPAVADASGSIAYAYGVTDPPQSFLVSPSGLVVGRYTGQLTSAFLQRWVGAAESS